MTEPTPYVPTLAFKAAAAALRFAAPREPAADQTMNGRTRSPAPQARPTPPDAPPHCTD